MAGTAFDTCGESGVLALVMVLSLPIGKEPEPSLWAIATEPNGIAAITAPAPTTPQMNLNCPRIQ
jgi:hypothetical protein